jgi:signal transduction histidine kinase
VPDPPPPPSPLLITGLGALAVAATGATFWASATSTVYESPLLVAVVRAVITASWALVGLATWERRSDSRLGPLIAAVAFLYAFTGLSALEAPVLFTIGAVAWPFMVTLVAAVVLTFPDGRLSRPASPAILLTMGGLSMVLWGLMLVGVRSTPTIAGPHRCPDDCPDNPFRVAEFSASLADGLERAAITVLAVAAIAVTVVLVAEWRSATPAWRRVLQPAVLALGTIAASFAVGTLLSATLGSDHDLAVVALWAPSFAGAAFPITLLVAQSRARLFTAGALRDIVGRLTPGTNRHDLEAMMATALGDPSLRLAFWVPGTGYVDVTGEPVDVSDRTAALTEIRDGERVVAAIRHDPVLERPVTGRVEEAGTAVLLALENARLEAEVRTTERDLRASRARILAAGMKERRRLERDLHDTAQQRLIMLRLKLDLAKQRAGDEATHRLLGQLGDEVEATIDGMRDIGHDLYPPLLGERGLVAALHAELRTARDTATLVAVGVERSRTEIEAAVYVCCREAIAVLADGAGPVRDVTLTLESRRTWLRIRLSGDTPAEAADLAERVAAHMRDPVAALGGRADVAAEATGRWAVTAYVPWPPRADGA